MPELKDELEGYFGPEVIDQLLGVLGSLGKRVVTVAALAEAAAQRGMDVSRFGEYVERLFECSAIGQAGGEGRRDGHLFKFRDPALSLNPERPVIIHRGAWRALRLAEEDS